ncbi:MULTISPECIES: translation elongation factor Ts [Helicobacter]|uniref:Elongation factor Ts n=1 Tax=Helicobacter ibis TaxID=2962633 RepID=A0ABT4VG20_9HELI|nr:MULTISPECIES: translation elongation factor Ts [Helicobacter]MDA3967977.1 translation elongation factor Ts [Helicobacter sp. WB40]MDA3969645.1 translation elongation factor Ts [Helicobacter ibis]
MAEISAQLVKQLREMTDAGMMDCKKALVETNGDIDKAVEYLREKGLSKAAKKADRVAAEGAINIKVASDFSKASMVEINSETDFVAKNDGFKELGVKTIDAIYDSNISSAEELHTLSLDGTKFEEYLKTQIAKIGENIVVRRIAKVSTSGNGIVNAYVHSNGRVGVIIALKCNKAESVGKLADFTKNLCMHAAAMKPQVISYESFDMDFIKSEKTAIIAELEKENEELKRLGKPLHKIPQYISQAELSDEIIAQQTEKLKEELKSQGKPEAIWDKILPGQIERFKADSTILDQRLTLLGQFYVMDDKKTIQQVLNEKGSELGDEISVVEYIRFELGEGIEKQESNFADEVAAQLG